jgi:8-oxo-dGTP diphosphatase
MQVTITWTGSRADALRRAMGMANESFADHLGVAVRTVAYWRKRSDMVPQRQMQEILDTALERATNHARDRFATAS